jgi:type II secretory ATPase GspE/PulE/Tfp pilus assembly ATPase PilB-like protein
VRDLTFKAESLDLIRATATASGNLRGLLADGARKVLRGDTSTVEVMRVVRLATNLEL